MVEFIVGFSTIVAAVAAVGVLFMLWGTSSMSKGETKLPAREIPPTAVMTDKMTYWKIGGVSLAGFSHLKEGIPCQDANAFRIRDDGQLIAAISDGSGSARYSHIGAQAFVDTVVSRIYHQPSSEKFDPQRIASWIATSVNDTRDQLIRHGDDLQDEGPSSLSDFAATLIVVVANLDDGAFFHVGDGAGTAFNSVNNAEVTVSKPENGEYANETYFLTMDDWERHLRIIPFIKKNPDTILLMSDGVTPMAMSKGCALPEFENFVKPVVKFLNDNDKETGEAGVTSTLSADGVRKITGDDKTLLWAIRVPS